MSTARARANHHLYLARIVLRAWREALQQRDIPASVLAQAFFPATRGHLLDAYGWFLLQVADPDLSPEQPPHSCAELPSRAEGKAIAGEIREFQQLESQGWLAELLARPVVATTPRSRPGSLAVATAEVPDPEAVYRWAERLEALFDRMSDSLDEY